MSLKILHPQEECRCNYLCKFARLSSSVIREIMLISIKLLHRFAVLHLSQIFLNHSLVYRLAAILSLLFLTFLDMFFHCLLCGPWQLLNRFHSNVIQSSLMNNNSLYIIFLNSMLSTGITLVQINSYSDCIQLQLICIALSNYFTLEPMSLLLYKSTVGQISIQSTTNCAISPT